MITAVEIENFKGIGERTRIEIKPITLLFGPNSAGKSTLLHALQLAREIFTRGNLDVDVTDGGAGFIDLGGFRNYVHNRDETKTVAMRFELDLSSTDFLTEFPIEEYVIRPPGRADHETLDISAIGDEIVSGWVEIAVSWTPQIERASIGHYTVGLNGQPFARCVGSEILFLNIYHPLVRWNSPEHGSIGVLDYLNSEARPSLAALFCEGDPIDRDSLALAGDEFPVVRTNIDEGPTPWILRECGGSGDDAQPLSLICAARPDGSAIRLWGIKGHVGFWSSGELARQLAAQVFEPPPDELDRRELFDRGEPEDGINWAYIGDAELTYVTPRKGGLPNFDRELQFQRATPARRRGGKPRLREKGRNEKRLQQSLFDKLLSRLLLVPGRILRSALSELRYIGPVRDAVPRNFFPQRFPDPRRWAGGLAAWEEISRHPEGLVTSVSEWLGSPDRLNTGYGMKVREFRELTADDKLTAILEDKTRYVDVDTDEFKVMLRDLLRTVPVKRQPRLVLLATGKAMHPADVGQGITQAVPVIVAALHPFPHGEKTRGGLVAIEQPELHLNPRQQAALGDVFLAAALQAPKSRFILETHSEHLILRLQRRIREATARRDALRTGEKQRVPLAFEPPPEERATSEDPLKLDVRDVDIGVYYVSSVNGRTLFEAMPLDLTGDFVMPWPDDFFEIDFHERFGE